MTALEADTKSTIDGALKKLQAELTEIEARRTRAEDEVEACCARIDTLTQRMTAIYAASSMLANLPAIGPDQEWLDHLVAWRKTLGDELRALPSTIRDSHTLGLEKNLKLSIQVIAFGPDMTNGSGYDLTTLRLGALMREAGFEPVGADSDRHYSGIMPWFGSLSEVERRISEGKTQYAKAEAHLADALLDDAERERRAIAEKARMAAINAAPVRKTRHDGSIYERYADGRVIEITG